MVLRCTMDTPAGRRRLATFLQAERPRPRPLAPSQLAAADPLHRLALEQCLGC